MCDQASIFLYVNNHFLLTCRLLIAREGPALACTGYPCCPTNTTSVRDDVDQCDGPGHDAILLLEVLCCLIVRRTQRGWRCWLRFLSHRYCQQAMLNTIATVVLQWSSAHPLSWPGNTTARQSRHPVNNALQACNWCNPGVPLSCH